MYPSLYGAICNDFEAGKIRYEGHWKGWALEVQTFLGPEMSASEATAVGSKKVEAKYIIHCCTCSVLVQVHF
jgi:hypothetical protein